MLPKGKHQDSGPTAPKNDSQDWISSWVGAPFLRIFPALLARVTDLSYYLILLRLATRFLGGPAGGSNLAFWHPRLLLVCPRYFELLLPASLFGEYLPGRMSFIKKVADCGSPLELRGSFPFHCLFSNSFVEEFRSRDFGPLLVPCPLGISMLAKNGSQAFDNTWCNPLPQHVDNQTSFPCCWDGTDPARCWRVNTLSRGILRSEISCLAID